MRGSGRRGEIESKLSFHAAASMICFLLTREARTGLQEGRSYRWVVKSSNFSRRERNCFLRRCRASSTSSSLPPRRPHLHPLRLHSFDSFFHPTFSHHHHPTLFNVEPSSSPVLRNRGPNGSSWLCSLLRQSSSFSDLSYPRDVQPQPTERSSPLDSFRCEAFGKVHRYGSSVVLRRR